MAAITDKNKVLRDHTPALIKKADDFVKIMQDKRFNGLNGDKRSFRVPDKTQFTGLVEAAQQACCVEELELFIRYKESKQGTSIEWKGLSEPLVKIIREVCALVAPELQLALVQRFIGYLMWSASVVRGGGR